jgi:O-antigen/teichoic acid export membrane protein
LIDSFLEKIDARFWLVADRGILAATSMVVVVTLARLLDVTTFGEFSTILAVWFLVEVLLRAAVLNPLVVFSGRSLQPAHLFGSWLLLSLIVAVAGTLLIVAPLSVALEPPSYARAVSANALFIVLPYAAFHSLRRALIQTGAQAATLLMAVSLCAANVAAMAAMWFGILPAELTTACLLVGGANLLATGVGWALGAFPVSLSRRYLNRLIGRLAQRRSVIFSTLLLEGPGTGLFSILLGTFGGAAQTAHYIAARTLLRPAGIVLSALDDADRTRASHALRAGKAAGLTRWYRSNRFVPAAIALIPLGLIFLFADEIAVLVYGQKFHDLGVPVQLCTLLFMIYAWQLPKIIYLITAGYEAELARAALAAVIVSLAALFAAVAAGYATAVAFLGAELCGAVLLAVLLGLTIEKAKPQAAAGAGDAGGLAGAAETDRAARP